MGLTQTPGARNALLAVAAAAIVAVMAGVWMWSQAPDYRILFSNFSDRDGGAIVASLQQMNVPYKFADGGGAILVPADQVYDARLKLAAQGLPKGGGVGFELMENQKLGVSQFLEQVNFQRALEGELARSIQAVGAVQSARIHLALPKASVFVREQQQPTASVLLNLHPGRTLDQQQVSAIVHLVASSVPNLPPKNVTLVDQNGNLLSESDKKIRANGLDPSQLKYVQELQQSIAQRVESIITPIVGPNNVRAEATADVDFSHSEQAAEIYKPNQTPDAGAVRSLQSSESQNGGSANPSGVPGALSNQPPVPATAPLTVPAVTGQAAGAANPPATTHKESTVNYEVDKTIRYVQQPMGGVKRLSVAVVVNYKRELDADGKLVSRPLSDAEKTQITDLVKEAMGYNKDRGDTLNVVNSPFAGVEKEIVPDVPLWKRPEALEMATQGGKYLLAGLVLLYLFFAFLRPTLRKLANPQPAALPEPVEEDAVVQISAATPDEPPALLPRTYQNNLDMARQLARDDPKVVANIVKNWVNSNE
ncbi:MAG TPA: flagellar basal-body MS-ring/collar protein FliF [Burkholderiaceae bacterium]|nr:flagellar basal-body MS-ring/collar protein FliF [Burkholderiaceae bacterium]